MYVRGYSIHQKMKEIKIGDYEFELNLFNIDNNILVNTPIHDYHKGGKNWLAIIKENPSTPGKLERNFAEKHVREDIST